MKARAAAVLALIIAVVDPEIVRANDSFAEVAAGGIRFLKQSDIVLQKELLTIRANKVEVVYRFSNPTDQEIVITVAFPLPEYSFRPGLSAAGPSYDFSVATNGRPQVFETLHQAKLKGQDVTDEIRESNLPLVDFRGWAQPEKDNPSKRLSTKVRESLVKRGLLGKEDGLPLWSAFVTHFWTQKFPAGQTIEISHSYTPQIGRELFGFDSSAGGWAAAQFPDGCVPSAKEVKQMLRPIQPDGSIFQTQVSYILTTANNWRAPIGEFILVVKKDKADTVVLCSDLPAPVVSDDKVEVRVENYRPSKDLDLFFLARKASR